MQITEPTTLITDYLLGALNLYLAARLWKTGKSKNSQSIKLEWRVPGVGNRSSGGRYIARFRILS